MRTPRTCQIGIFKFKFMSISPLLDVVTAPTPVLQRFAHVADDAQCCGDTEVGSGEFGEAAVFCVVFGFVGLAEV